MKHTPQIAQTAARTEIDAARDACPHWDGESDGAGHECCYRVDEAKRAYKRMRQAVQRFA
jgi:hypothetical protein